jgi:hypothetical protein
MRCAVIDVLSNVVLNVIVADPADPAPDGSFLIGMADDVACGIGYIYDPATGTFTSPYPEVDEDAR